MSENYFDLPQYDGWGDFTTEIECLGDTPGFFPVHGGRLPEGLSQAAPPRVVIVGLDWGKQARAEACRRAWADGRPCRCQRFRPGQGTPGPYLTERNMFDVLVEANLDLKAVFLTNAVLGLAKAQTENTEKFRNHPKYLQACGAYHRRTLAAWGPRLVVLMGKAHLGVYGRNIWSQVWPELFASRGVWAGMRELRDAFRSDRTMARAESGMYVQVMHHPRSYTSPRLTPSRKRTVADLAAIAGREGRLKMSRHTKSQRLS